MLSTLISQTNLRARYDYFPFELWKLRHNLSLSSGKCLSSLLGYFYSGLLWSGPAYPPASCAADVLSPSCLLLSFFKTQLRHHFLQEVFLHHYPLHSLAGSYALPLGPHSFPSLGLLTNGTIIVLCLLPLRECELSERGELGFFVFNPSLWAQNRCSINECLGMFCFHPLSLCTYLNAATRNVQITRVACGTLILDSVVQDWLLWGCSLYFPHLCLQNPALSQGV